MWIILSYRFFYPVRRFLKRVEWGNNTNVSRGTLEKSRLQKIDVIVIQKSSADSILRRGRYLSQE